MELVKNIEHRIKAVVGNQTIGFVGPMMTLSKKATSMIFDGNIVKNINQIRTAFKGNVINQTWAKHIEAGVRFIPTSKD
jgi:hypothetical protein